MTADRVNHLKRNIKKRIISKIKNNPNFAEELLEDMVYAGLLNGEELDENYEMLEEYILKVIDIIELFAISGKVDA